MKQTILKTSLMVFAFCFLSLVGFNVAYGYGGSGGGGNTTCATVTYGGWGSCINGFQYREANQTNCSLTASQQLARSRACVVEPVTTLEITPIVAEETEPTAIVTPEPELIVPTVLGETTYANGTLLRGSDMKVYVVVNGALKHIKTLAELAKYAGKEILNVSDDAITSFGEGVVKGETTYANGTLLRGSDMKVYVVVNGSLKHIVSLQELLKYAGKEILNVSDDVISGFVKA